MEAPDEGIRRTAFMEAAAVADKVADQVRAEADEQTGEDFELKVSESIGARAVAAKLHELAKLEGRDLPPTGGHVSDSPRLSRMLFEAREQIEMWADVVEARSGSTDQWARRLIAEIDQYRAEKGWSSHGFGGEDQPTTNSGSHPSAVDHG